MRLMPSAARTPWVPFVGAALAFTVLLGALNGALNLWSLHVLQRGVPLEHHQAHALAQLFGFMWLLTAGVSFHLAPRLFGGAPPARRQVQVVAVGGIGGVTLLVLGRLGDLLPGCGAMGLLGAALLLAAMTEWARFTWRLYRERQVEGDWLPMFVVAGAGWWLLSAGLLFGWQVGQTLSGPLRELPFEVLTATALWGGTASWVLGITLRAGACTMRVARAPVERQRLGFFAWQAAAVAMSAEAALRYGGGGGALALLGAAGLVAMLLVVRPFRRPADAAFPDEPLVRVAMVGAWAFAAVTAGLLGWQGLGAFGVVQPPLLRDAARHAFSLGFMQLAVFAFAGRMLPGFEGVALRTKGLYDAGVLALMAGAGLRITGALAPWKPAMVASGVSGPLALCGVTLIAVTFARTLRLGALTRRTPPGAAGLDLRVTVGS